MFMLGFETGRSFEEMQTFVILVNCLADVSLEEFCPRFPTTAGGSASVDKLQLFI